MNLLLSRKTKTQNAILGDLSVSDKFNCYTLENANLAIPAGRYVIELYDSPKHGPDTPQLKDVPGRTNIQIHIADFWHELLGCIAPGTSHGSDYIESSGAAFKPLKAQIVAAIQAGQTVTIEIRNI